MLGLLRGRGYKCQAYVGAGKTGNGGKCKRSVWPSESWKNPKSVLWNNEIQAAVRRKAAWKVVLAASKEEAK